MRVSTYRNFDLQIRRHDADASVVQRRFVVSCDYEGMPSSSVVVEADLNSFAGVGDGASDDAREFSVGRRSRIPQSREIRLGVLLFETFIKDDVRERFLEARSRASEAGCGLRIRIVTALPEIEALPWETLTLRATPDKPGTVLACERATPIVRSARLEQIGERRDDAHLILRVLVVLSSPKSLSELGATLDLKREQKNIAEALRWARLSGAVRVEWLNPATIERLTERLQNENWDVIHVASHGGRDERGPYLVLGDAAPERLYADMLIPLLRHQHRLVMAVLNSCHGADRATSHVPALSRALLDANVRVVIAMQGAIRDAAAKIFPRALYSALSRGRPLEAALSDARQTLLVRESSAPDRHLTAQSWWRPAAYIRDQGKLKRPRLPLLLFLTVLVIVCGSAGAYARSMRFAVRVFGADGKALIGATVNVKEKPSAVAKTDASGLAQFSFWASHGTITVKPPSDGPEYRELVERPVENGKAITMCWLTEKSRQRQITRCYIEPNKNFKLRIGPFGSSADDLPWSLIFGDDMLREPSFRLKAEPGKPIGTSLADSTKDMELGFANGQLKMHEWRLIGPERPPRWWEILQGKPICANNSAAEQEILLLVSTEECTKACSTGVCN